METTNMVKAQEPLVLTDVFIERDKSRVAFEFSDFSRIRIPIGSNELLSKIEDFEELLIGGQVLYLEVEPDVSLDLVVKPVEDRFPIRILLGV